MYAIDEIPDNVLLVLCLVSDRTSTRLSSCFVLRRGEEGERREGRKEERREGASQK